MIEEITDEEAAALEEQQRLEKQQPKVDAARSSATPAKPADKPAGKAATSPADLSTAAYEAALNAEVEKLKLGDRAAASSAAAAGAFSAATPASVTAADSSSANDAAPASSDASTTVTSSDGTAPITSEPVLVKDLALALEAKARGNQHYARQQYDEAIAEYSRAIAHCPVSPAPPAEAEPNATAEEGAAPAAPAADAGAESADAARSSSTSSVPPEAKEHLSVFYSNRAAAFLMQSKYAECVADASASLELHPANPKPLSRRAKAHEALDQLAEAVEDLKALVALDPSDRDAARNLARVDKALQEKNEKMKTEMLGKLKDFGNSLLGKFGLSLDNFKATQDPSTGSYNISFGK